MKNALILQGWYQQPESNWYPWLKAELKKMNYKVDIPDLPTMQTESPDLEKQLNFLLDTHTITQNTSIFGHSLGALLGMRVAEAQSIDALFLIAGWDFNDLTYEHRLFWKSPIDHEQIKENTNRIVVVSSDTDPYITAFQCEEMCKRLEGEFILIKNAGHFTSKDGVKQIEELLHYL